MTARTMNELFYTVSHYDPAEAMGDGVTTLNTQLEEQYIPMGIELYNAITDEDLAVTIGSTANAMTFGSAYEYQNQIVAYICTYLAEVDMHPNEFRGNESAIWASKYMQQALQLIQLKYPDRIKAKTVGGVGMVWMLDPDRRHNISLLIGVMRSNYSSSFGSQPGINEPTSTNAMLGR